MEAGGVKSSQVNSLVAVCSAGVRARWCGPWAGGRRVAWWPAVTLV